MTLSSRRAASLLTGALLVAGVVSAAPAVAATTTYYVNASTGTDTTANSRGLSAAKPWKTAQYAVNTAAASSKITFAAGMYTPFTVSRPNLTLVGPTSGGAKVVGRAGVANVVTVNAAGTTLRYFTVSGCVPNRAASPIEQNGSAQVRVSSGGANAVLDHLTVANSHGTDTTDPKLMIGCYGVLIVGASGTHVTNSDISHNGAGVYVYGGGANIKIQSNSIHDNDVLIRSSYGNNDDFGAVGVDLDHTTSSPGPVISGNTLYLNVGQSADYGTDGGATEIFASTNVSFTGNTMHDNDGVFESGTADGAPCGNNTFSGNTAYGKASGSTLASASTGMYIRCAMTVTNNNFRQLNYSAISFGADGFSASLSGLRITGNTINQSPLFTGGDSELTYQVNGYPSFAGVTIDNNCFTYTNQFAKYQLPDGSYAALPSLAAWQSRYGFDLHPAC